MAGKSLDGPKKGGKKDETKPLDPIISGQSKYSPH